MISSAGHPQIGGALDLPPVPPRHALQHCMRQLVQATVAALPCESAQSAETAGMLIARLTCLQGYLVDSAPPVGRFDAVVTQMVPAAEQPLDPLITLLKWQLRLEIADRLAQIPGLSLAAALLHDLLRQQLETIARLCTVSAWAMENFSTSGLVQHWTRALALASFSRQDTAGVAISRLADECLRLHLQPGLQSPGRLESLQQALAERAENPFGSTNIQKAAAAALPALPTDLQNLAAAELARYRLRLASLLAASPDKDLEPGELLLTLLYKLAWVSDVGTAGALALAWRSAHQVCSEFWFQHRPLPQELTAVLAHLLAVSAPGSAPSPYQWPWLWQTRLLRCWPCDDSGAALAIGLANPAADAAKAARLVQLKAVPLLLADSFSLLIQAPAPAWFVERGLHDPAIATLLQELALLEKGAAAVKVWALEQLCTLLLEVYAAVESSSAGLPAELLSSAHAHLVQLLDRAAAWQETMLDDGIVAALQQYLNETAERRPALSIASPTIAETAAAQLYQALLAYVRTLALVVDKPVRVQVDPDNEVLATAALLQVAEALKPLLRFVLLDNASAAYTRRAAHKPLVHTLSIHLRREAGVLRILLAEDNEGAPLTPVQLRQLQRQLPPTAGPLDCELHHGQGRWFSFTLAEL